MILPIVAYGDPVLRKESQDISAEYPKLKDLIANMYDTMYDAYGVGLAAPQVGLPIRLFLVDTTPFADDEDLTKEEQASLKDFKRTFINAEILEETGDEWAFNEGCLSIPEVREDVFRKPKIKIQYQEGILFTDKLSALKKRLIKSRLNNISKGNINVDYKMRFPAMKKKR